MVGERGEDGAAHMFDSHSLLRSVLLDITYASSPQQQGAHQEAMARAEQECMSSLDNIALPLWPPHAYDVFC
eukprot:1367839-Rhodomonas_salina.1